MSKLNLSNWIFDDIVPGEERFAEVSIIVKYPELHLLVDSIPSERPKVRKFLRDVYVKQLIDTKLFEAYELIETSGGLIGIKTKIEFRLLEKVEALDFVESISLRQIDHGREIKRRAVKRFYCVKMTVAIEIENKVAGMQSIEERFVLVKAKSNLDAYSKIEKHKESYSEPYLNSDGYMVRWRIESLDDCFETGITSFKDLNDPEGAEVFSVLKNRKLTQDRQWDGKF